MLAKDLIKILEQNPDAIVRVHGSYGDYFVPQVVKGDYSKQKIFLLHCSNSNEHSINKDWVENKVVQRF